MAKYRNRSFEDTLAITKALADEQRVRALLALGAGELCACQLNELLELAPSTVSKHMSILRQAGLVECRKQGRWCYFSQANGTATEEARAAIDWLARSLAEAPRIREDRQRLRQIVKMDPEDLCRGQQCGPKC